MSVFNASPSYIAKIRKGDSSDPYVDISEEKQVINNVVHLSEIPNKFYELKVFTEDDVRLSEVKSKPSSANSFRVDYENGYVFFSKDNDSKYFTFEYKGMGVVLISHDRIYTDYDGISTTETLKDVISRSKVFFKELGNFEHKGIFKKDERYHYRNIVNSDNETYMFINDDPDGAIDTSLNDEKYWKLLTTVKEDVELINELNEEVSANEEVRKNNEEIREDSESERKSSEDTRELNESTRNNSESDRELQEADRSSNESTRELNEDSRILNETTREDEYYNVLKPDILSATSGAEKATSDTESAIADANLATTNANESALYADGRGDYANSEGAYATTQGDRALQSSIDADNATDGAISATNDANLATDNANQSATNADLSATNADSSADHATTQGDHAKVQGDYAKSQGDEVQSIINGGVVETINNMDGHVTLDIITQAERDKIATVDTDIQNAENSANKYTDDSLSAYSTHWTEIVDKPTEFNPESHTHDKSEVGLSDVDNVKQATKTEFDSHVSQKGQADGFASLDSSSHVPLNQLPDIAKQSTHVVDNSTEREALTDLIEGERAYEVETGDSYIWDGGAWVLMASADWENVSLEWENISNRPTSTTTQIDNAVDHKNLTDNPHNVNKSQVGLGNVDNTKQATKTEFDSHINDNSNPHSVSKDQVGLGNVDNYSRTHYDGRYASSDHSHSEYAELDASLSTKIPKDRNLSRNVLLNAYNFSDFVKQSGNAESSLVEDETLSLLGSKTALMNLDNDLDYEYMSMRNNSIRPFKIEDGIVVNLFLERAKNLIQLELYFAKDTGYTQFGSKLFTEEDLVDGWNQLVIRPDDLAVTGEDSFTDPRESFQIRVEMYQSNPDDYGAKVYFDSITSVKKDRKSKVVFMFDDGWESQYTNAFPILLERGMVGNIGVVPTWVNTYPEPDYEPVMTLNQLTELHQYGWSLFNHTNTHPNLDDVSVAEAVDEIADCKDWLNTNGFPEATNILAYPYGGHEDISKESSFASEITYGRTLATGLAENTFINKTRGKTINIIPQNMPQFYKDEIDRAIDLGQDIVFCVHIVSDTETDPYGIVYSIANFTDIADYLYTNSASVEVISVSDWINLEK